MCVGCDEPFEFAPHRSVMEGLLANPHVAELRRAMYVQDILHQFASRAHFDNCDFDGALAYLGELWRETGAHVDAARQAPTIEARDAAARKAFFAIGQALHAIQDFYATPTTSTPKRSR